MGPVKSDPETPAAALTSPLLAHNNSLHKQVGFSQETVKAPESCCRAAAEVFTPQFQQQCACLPELTYHTKNIDKELMDYCECLETRPLICRATGLRGSRASSTGVSKPLCCVGSADCSRSD